MAQQILSEAKKGFIKLFMGNLMGMPNSFPTTKRKLVGKGR
jgi:hypothetical protein